MKAKVKRNKTMLSGDFECLGRGIKKYTFHFVLRKFLYAYINKRSIEVFGPSGVP